MGRGGSSAGRGGGGKGAAKEISAARSAAIEANPSYRRSYPVGKAQQAVLSALGTSVENNAQAEALFRNLGFTVATARQGRVTVPRIVPLGSTAVRNQGGDFDIAGRSISPGVRRLLRGFE